MITHAKRVELFGSFRFEHRPVPGNPECVRIIPPWPQQNMVTVTIPQLAKLGRSTKLAVHGKAAQPITVLFARWDEAGFIGPDKIVHTFNGCWSARFKRQEGTELERSIKCSHLSAISLSNHTWGTAIDINAQEWPLGKNCPLGSDMRKLVPIARELGFEWGGDYASRIDAMHFELVRV